MTMTNSTAIETTRTPAKPHFIPFFVFELELVIRQLYNIGLFDLRKEDRRKEVRIIRQVSSHVLYNYGNIKYETIGMLIDHDHVTVRHGNLKTINAIEGYDTEMLKYHDAIVNQLRLNGAI